MKNNIVKMLMGKIPDYTLHKSVKTSRDKVERAKKFGIKKTGQVTKKSDRQERVVNISDNDLKSVLETVSTDSCRFLADKRVLKTVA